MEIKAGKKGRTTAVPLEINRVYNYNTSNNQSATGKLKQRAKNDSTRAPQAGGRTGTDVLYDTTTTAAVRLLLSCIPLKKKTRKKKKEKKWPRAKLS